METTHQVPASHTKFLFLFFSLCDGFLESQAGDSEMVFMILHMMVSHNSVNLSFQVQSFLQIPICPTVVLFTTLLLSGCEGSFNMLVRLDYTN